MPVVERISWLIRQVESGRKAHLSIGEALDDNKVKAKISLEPQQNGAISTAVKLSVKCHLIVLRNLAASNISVDRGHFHKSSGRSVVSIWITTAPSSVSAPSSTERFYQAPEAAPEAAPDAAPMTTQPTQNHPPERPAVWELF